jgi:predicted negative regulator of RcsB-dependent stress response
MAESYQTEEEQIEALKNWWKENGQSTVVSIVVAIAAVFGWQALQSQQQAELNAASAVYQNMLAAADVANGSATPEQLATANHLAGTLKQDFPDSTYARFAALYKAKMAVEKNDLATAEQELRWVLDNGTTPELTELARLRLARVLYAQDKFEEALTQLEGEVAAYAASYEETRGDIYLAQAKPELALLSYQKASELNQQAEATATNPLLEIKLQQLKSSQGKAVMGSDSDNATVSAEGE